MPLGTKKLGNSAHMLIQCFSSVTNIETNGDDERSGCKIPERSLL